MFDLEEPGIDGDADHRAARSDRRLDLHPPPRRCLVGRDVSLPVVSWPAPAVSTRPTPARHPFEVGLSSPKRRPSVGPAAQPVARAPYRVDCPANDSLVDVDTAKVFARRPVDLTSRVPLNWFGLARGERPGAVDPGQGPAMRDWAAVYRTVRLPCISGCRSHLKK
jgi:hypothetical protein